ncbi:MAG: DUF2336 domain-containing protein [Bradyrhizobium sp.]
MTEAKPFCLKELNDAISEGSPESRARALWHATDLLIEGRYTEDQIWVFGEVIGRLADEIEHAARAKLAKRLAHSDNAPFKVVMVLAFDDSIDVAGPILQYSRRIDSESLVSNIRTKSQPHLLAISKRNSIPVEVTDELVTRGNREVVQSVASNNGACFSDFGFLQMIKRSETDSILAEQLGLRKEIPRHMFQQLIAKASYDVKHKLEQERPDLADEINVSVGEVTGKLHAKFGPATKSYFAAKRSVTGQHQYGNLNEKRILEYSRAHKIEEVTVGLSLLCSLPADVVERTLVHDNREMILILAKAIGFEWETTMSLLFLGAKNHRIPAGDLDNLREEFARLNTETSRGVLKLYQSRKYAASVEQDQRRLPQLHA